MGRLLDLLADIIREEEEVIAERAARRAALQRLLGVEPKDEAEAAFSDFIALLHRPREGN
jgi:hypothetical protein